MRIETRPGTCRLDARLCAGDELLGRRKAGENVLARTLLGCHLGDVALDRGMLAGEARRCDACLPHPKISSNGNRAVLSVAIARHKLESLWSGRWDGTGAVGVVEGGRRRHCPVLRVRESGSHKMQPAQCVNYIVPRARRTSARAHFLLLALCVRVCDAEE